MLGGVISKSQLGRHSMPHMSPKCVLQSSSYHMPWLAGVYSRLWFDFFLIGAFCFMQYEPILLGPQYRQKKSAPKNTIRCNVMKSKRLILIILERYKLDNLVPMICSILLYRVVFVRNPIFWGVPIGTKNPNWDARVMSR